MALFVSGMKCPICGKPMSPKDIVSFPPFVANELDPLWIFNDRSLHESCFRSHPLSDQANARLNRVEGSTGPGRRRCEVCNQQVTDPDNFLPLGFLSESPPLSAFNLLTFHRTCFAHWPRSRELADLIRAALSDGTVRGSAYDRLLGEIQGDAQA